MKIYVWEGNGISSAYHDDGTLVVLADSPDQARQIVRDGAVEREARQQEWYAERDRLWAEQGVGSTMTAAEFWHSDAGTRLMARSIPYDSGSA